MTKSALLLLAALPALGACASGTGKPATDQSGSELFQSYCANCHGTDGRGTFLNLGPSFESVREYWGADSLLVYIADPKAFAARTERLGEREMTAIADDVPQASRERLVEFALTLMD
ncbi:MAG: cytochrome c [Planctomycetota bacterium]|nr:MAG: cytochrome c [Planctomycetota bacterium]